MDFVNQINSSAYAQLIRNSDILYPIFQVIHVCGIGVFIGSLLVGNVKMLGAGRDLSFQDFSRHIYRWALFGALLILVSGTQMFTGFISVFAVNPVFGIKLTFIVIAIAVNVRLYRYHITHEESIGTNGLPSWVRWSAYFSIVVLLSIVVMGKLLAYIGGKD